MLRIEKHIPAPNGLAKALLTRMPKLELPFAERSKSRLRVMLSNGMEAAVFLPRGTVLRGGDVLTAVDGSLIAVTAAPQKVLVITADDRVILMRAAYHLGNRHTPVEVGENYLKIEHDPVLAGMLRQLDANIVEQMTSFEPEAGAYMSKLGGGHKHGHDETFTEDYALAQAAYQSHEHTAHDHDHTHFPDHADHHDHDHHHGHSHQ